jgi:hypothetical protein
MKGKNTYDSDALSRRLLSYIFGIYVSICRKKTLHTVLVLLFHGQVKGGLGGQIPTHNVSEFLRNGMKFTTYILEKRISADRNPAIAGADSPCLILL